MGLKLVVPPESDPVTLEEVKAQLSITHTDEDTMLTALIRAATDSLDGPYGDLCGRALMPQTWDLYRDSFPDTVSSLSIYSSSDLGGSAIRIPLPPLIEIESVNYIDPDTEMETTLATSEYEVDTAGLPYGWVVPISTGWPTPLDTTNAIRIRFVAGYRSDDSPDVVAVPESIRQAIIMLVMDMYGRGSAFVDRTQTPTRETIEYLIRQHVLRVI